MQSKQQFDKRYRHILLQSLLLVALVGCTQFPKTVEELDAMTISQLYDEYWENGGGRKDSRYLREIWARIQRRKVIEDAKWAQYQAQEENRQKAEQVEKHKKHECAEILAEKENWYGHCPENYESLIKSYLSKTLYDPHSLIDLSIGSPRKTLITVEEGDAYWAGWIIPVSYNAKNRFGGYVGLRHHDFYLFGQEVTDIWWPRNGNISLKARSLDHLLLAVRDARSRIVNPVSDKVVLTNVRYGKTSNGQNGIFCDLKNGTDKSIDKVVVEARYLDAQGQVLHKERVAFRDLKPSEQRSGGFVVQQKGQSNIVLEIVGIE